MTSSAPAVAAPIEGRVVLRPIGHPLPLGFIGLAAATTVVAALHLGWIPAAETPNVAWVLIAFVFPTQLVSSVFGFLGRDTVAGTSMAVLAGTWLSIGLVLQHSPPGSTSKALGMFLFVGCLAMAIPAAAAFGGKVVPAMVLSTTALRFVVTGLYQWTGAAGWKAAASVVGLVLGALALYAALAVALEDVQGRTVLPTARRGEGEAAVEGSLADQFGGVEHEPGVRAQL
jgi:succinate-acetate transporter protein